MKQIRISELDRIAERKETIPIAAVFVLRNEYDSDWKCVTDSEEIHEWIEFAKGCKSCGVKLHYEPVDDAFVMEIIMDPVPKEEVYETAKVEARKEILCVSNRIGRRYEDEDGWVWYGW
ncbi:MAG: hypothetical protein N2V72_00515 [Methanophagales archaeon]|nr:hypothetical protein [Methanophagales archaeon]